MILFVLTKEMIRTAKITLRDIYWDKYDVSDMAVADLIRAMCVKLAKNKYKEFCEIALIWHTILTLKQILKEGNLLSDINTELGKEYINERCEKKSVNMVPSMIEYKVSYLFMQAKFYNLDFLLQRFQYAFKITYSI